MINYQLLIHLMKIMKKNDYWKKNLLINSFLLRFVKWMHLKKQSYYPLKIYAKKLLKDIL